METTDKDNIRKLEEFILFLGDLCDSPNSLRYHLAVACKHLDKPELNLYRHWKHFLKEEP